jgi:hypothetical protein
VRLQLKTPKGLETAASRGPYSWHAHQDYSCEIESEDLPFDCGHWESSLRASMRVSSFEWLNRHFPELKFSWVKAKPASLKAGGPEFVEKRGNGWITGAWKTAQESKMEEKRS